MWAVEANNGPDRLVCQECNDRLRTQRGCKRPGEDNAGSQVFRSSSPMLADSEDGRLYECPTGMLIRDAPWVFDAMRASSCAESAGFDVHRQSVWLQNAVGIVSSERERMRELKDTARKTKADAGYASRVLSKDRR